MKIVVVVSWRPDAEPAAIEEFLRSAPEALAEYPFIACESGLSQKLGRGAGNSGDWSFVAEVDGPDDVARFIDSEAHAKFGAKLGTVVGQFMSVQF